MSMKRLLALGLLTLMPLSCAVEKEGPPDVSIPAPDRAVAAKLRATGFYPDDSDEFLVQLAASVCSAARDAGGIGPWMDTIEEGIRSDTDTRDGVQLQNFRYLVITATAAYCPELAP